MPSAMSSPPATPPTRQRARRMGAPPNPLAVRAVCLLLMLVLHAFSRVFACVLCACCACV